MNAPAEFDRVASGSFVWHRHDSEMKADVFATGLVTKDCMFLVDPFAVEPEPLRDVIGRTRVAGVVVTNENHIRASLEFAANFEVPIFARREAAIRAAPVSEVVHGSELSTDVTVISIQGAAAGEIALCSTSRGGTVVIGDALINFGAYGFSFLPTKYCSNPKLMRKSLRKLLDFQFEQILFAHGEPILTGGRARLEALLNQAG